MHLSGFQVLLLGAMACLASGQAAPKICTTADLNKQFCKDCMTTSVCETANAAPVTKTTCKTGEACTVLLAGKFAVCKAIAQTPCACGATPAKCDAYNPDSLFLCLSGGVTKVSPCKTDNTCINGKCVIAPTEPTTVAPGEICKGAKDGFVAVPPACSSAAYCDQEIFLETYDCKTGEYFDLDELVCLPAPPQPCPASCGTGACGDKSDCSKWYICDAGKLLDEETCTDALPDFDSTTSGCVAAGKGTCSLNKGCNFDLVPTEPMTTLTTSTSKTSTTSSITTSSLPPSSSTSSSTTTSTPTTTTSTSSTTTSTPTTTTRTSSTTTSTPTTTTSTTTSRPATCSAANVGTRYPIAGDCKKYQTCRLVATNVYAYVEGTCLGTLVFNSKTSYCDTLANVPGCVTTG